MASGSRDPGGPLRTWSLKETRSSKGSTRSSTSLGSSTQVELPRGTIIEPCSTKGLTKLSDASVAHSSIETSPIRRKKLSCVEENSSQLQIIVKKPLSSTDKIFPSTDTEKTKQYPSRHFVRETDILDSRTDFNIEEPNALVKSRKITCIGPKEFKIDPEHLKSNVDSGTDETDISLQRAQNQADFKNDNKIFGSLECNQVGCDNHNKEIVGPKRSPKAVENHQKACAGSRDIEGLRSMSASPQIIRSRISRNPLHGSLLSLGPRKRDMSHGPREEGDQSAAHVPGLPQELWKKVEVKASAFLSAFGRRKH